MEFHSKSMERRVVFTLAQHLRDAAAAHHKYEEDMRSKDLDWAGWYAHFLVAKVPRFNSPATENELRFLLIEASKKFTGDDWPERYAEYILKQKGGETNEDARS